MYQASGAASAASRGTSMRGSDIRSWVGATGSFRQSCIPKFGLVAAPCVMRLTQPSGSRRRPSATPSLANSSPTRSQLRPLETRQQKVCAVPPGRSSCTQASPAPIGSQIQSRRRSAQGRPAARSIAIDSACTLALDQMYSVPGFAASGVPSASRARWPVRKSRAPGANGLIANRPRSRPPSM